MKMRDQTISRATDVAVGPTSDALFRIAEPGQAVAIWRRARDSRFAEWIDTLHAAQLPHVDVYCLPNIVAEVVQYACDDVGMPRSEHRERLCADIGMLAVLFAQVMKVDTVRLRLEAVNDDSCRKFHLDYVTTRLLCTYRGGGTEYGVAHIGANEPEETACLGTEDVAIFRGARWPGPERSGILHRSPPMTGQSKTRLLLALDGQEADGFEP